IDHNEYENLSFLMDNLFNVNQGTVMWDKRHPAPGSTLIARQHEYIVPYSKAHIKLQKRKTNAQTIIEKANNLIKETGKITDEVRTKFKRWIKNQDKFTGGEKAYNLIDEEGRVFQSVHLGASEQRTDEKYFIPF